MPPPDINNKRLAWALFVLFLLTLGCCQPTELILGFSFFSYLFNFYPLPPQPSMWHWPGPVWMEPPSSSPPPQPTLRRNLAWIGVRILLLGGGEGGDYMTFVSEMCVCEGIFSSLFCVFRFINWAFSLLKSLFRTLETPVADLVTRLFGLTWGVHWGGGAV